MSLGLIGMLALSGGSVALAQKAGYVACVCDTPNTVIMALTAVFCVYDFWTEYLGKAQLAYSKFSNGRGNISTELGWLIVYGVPALVYWLLYWSVDSPDTVFHRTFMMCYVGHFLKRCFEVVFVHKYSSRTMKKQSVFTIAFLYSTGAAVAHYAVNMAVSVEDAQAESLVEKIPVGMCVFLFGEFINFYHHCQLSFLRKHGSSAYVVPEGGLFSLIVCPNYLGEIIAWFGLALMSQQVALYASWFAVVMYLSGRAHQTKLWYAKKMETFPLSRARLVPFVF